MASKGSQSAMEARTTSGKRLAERCATRQGSRGVVDDREMVEKRLQTRLLLENGESEAHHGGSRITPPIGNHAQRNPLTAVNPNSEPWRAQGVA